MADVPIREKDARSWDMRHLKPVFIEKLKERPNIGWAADQIGVARSTVYDWRNEDAQFANDWDQCFLTKADNVEENLFERAQRNDTVAAIFVSKAWKPERYNQDNRNVNVGNKDGEPFKIQQVDLTEEELNRRIAAIVSDDED